MGAAGDPKTSPVDPLSRIEPLPGSSRKGAVMKRILVIDDNVYVRSLLREMLELANYEVTEAPNGEIGERLFRQNPVDLVITDIFMPEKEGLETIRELRRSFPEVKIIAISGGGSRGDLAFLPTAKKLGAHRTFVKPFEMDEILAAIRELLGEP
jgi:DNA-binding response OmpR family regulator